jgi:hypothetical protein
MAPFSRPSAASSSVFDLALHSFNKTKPQDIGGNVKRSARTGKHVHQNNIPF